MSRAGGSDVDPTNGSQISRPEDVHWRQRVNDDFQKRRMRPDAIKRNLEKAASKLAAPVAIRTPAVLLSPTRASAGENPISIQHKLRRTGNLSTTTSFPKHERAYDSPRSPIRSARSTSPDEKEATHSSFEEKQRTSPLSPSAPHPLSPTKSKSGSHDRELRPRSAARLHRMMQKTSIGIREGITPDAPASSTSSSSAPAMGYELPPPTLDELYPTSRPHSISLSQGADEDDAQLYSGSRAKSKSHAALETPIPLELFDDDETDLSPEQWLALNETKYDNKGVPARSLFYINKEWVWSRCVVIGYRPSSSEFLIEFPRSKIQKYVRRLSILFDDEDERKFHARVERCRQRLDEARAMGRYEAYVDSQPSSLFSPIEQRALHGIVGKLMLHSEDLVMARQRSVETLLIEVRDEYARSMKQALVDYKRQNPVEEAKMSGLRLPPPPTPPKVPYLAVVPTPKHAFPLPKTRKAIAELHYSHHVEAAQVLLALHKAWDPIKGHHFLDTDDSKMSLPMLLYEYQEHQEMHFNILKDKIANDWRSLAVNLIRDNLNNVFKFFVNDPVEYEKSELKRFLKMVSFMLREHLGLLIEQSILAYVKSFEPYRDMSKPFRPFSIELVLENMKAESKRLEAARQNRSRDDDEEDEEEDRPPVFVSAEEEAEVAAEEERIQAEIQNKEIDPMDLVGGYLNGTLSKGCRPMFIFKMTTANGRVMFLPGLESIELSVLSLVKLPHKLHALSQIDSELVPLINLMNVPLMQAHASPRVFAMAEQARQRLKDIISYNLRQPRALAALYQSYGALLAMNADEYVEEWFATKERKQKQEEDAKAAQQQQLQQQQQQQQQQQGKKDSEENDEDEGERPASVSAASFWTNRNKNEEQPAPVKKKSHLVAFPKPKHSIAETKAEIQKFQNAISEIQNRSPSEVIFPLIKVECRLVKEQLMSKSKEMATKLMEGLATQIRETNLFLQQQFEAMLQRIKTRSDNVSDLAELKERSISIEKEEIPYMQKQIAAMQEEMSVLEEFGFPVTRADFNLAWNVAKYPQTVSEAMEDTKLQIDMDNSKFLQQLQEEQTVFQADLEEYSKEVDTFFDFGLGSSAQMEQYAAKVEALQEKLEKAEQTVQSFQNRNALFGDVPTEYSELVELRTKFRPFFQLWSTTSQFNASCSLWMNGPFTDLNPTQIAKEVSSWHKLMYRLEKELASMNAPKPAEVAVEMKTRIGAFKENVPIITWLCSPGLKPRHWNSISELLCPGRPPISPDHDLTLQHILSLDVARHRHEIEEICIFATKEYGIDQTLDKMKREWKNMNLDLEAYKNSNTYFLRGYEDIRSLIDDQILKTQAMRGSPYVKFFEVKCKKWEARLQLISHILEEWMECQKTWLYLEPIFNSEDIMRQMPTEGRRFAVVDQYWRKTMEQAKKMPNILDFVSETDNLLKTFQEQNKMLELIGKGLNDYLETKRMAFPRFFFLSNDQLLSILSQTKNPTAVQTHLITCFDNINRLDFTEDKHIIVGMQSLEGERVPFCEPVDPNVGPKKGNVEVWLRDVERVMRTSLQKLASKAIVSYEVTPREQWILQQPGQLTLVISQLMWTKEVTEALGRAGTQGLRDYLRVLNQQLDRLVELVRGPLTPLERATLSALTVIDVHARDVVQKMIEEGVNSDHDFEWLAQLRYYWESKNPTITSPTSTSASTTPLNTSRGITTGNSRLGSSSSSSRPSAASLVSRQTGKTLGGKSEGKSSLSASTSVVGHQVNQAPSMEELTREFGSDSGVLRARMVNTSMDYAYEYIGNTSRLVITPLTDRCYRTLMGAIHMSLGGAPEGPAGTGKTETVKDLSKAMGIQCVVYNGSESFTFRAVAKLLKGLAASGGWCCFDEFNRIDIEVLSVIAQQISSIQRAILENKHTFFFDGANIPLIHTCNVFVTMNPGYAGRAELPDNLKTLFRTVAMMIPDYAMIAEILLYSYGYSGAPELARKIVACLRLSSEQLSAQDHYDFGMRNVTSILNAAGALKRRLPNVPEDILCLRAISDCNVPKFISADIPLFKGITQDLFPGLEPQLSDSEALQQAVISTLQQQNLQPVPAFVHKVMELYDTVEVRHGLMLVGAPFSGKSVAIRTLQHAITSLAQQQQEQREAARAQSNSEVGVHGDESHFQEVNVSYLNPKSITMNQLYGANDPNTQEWVDGVLPVIMRACVNDESPRWKWVVFDGPVDAVWIESMNTVLDDNKKLCLTSGEVIKLRPHMNMVFEVEDMSQASPATVSRCGMIYMEPHQLGWSALTESWLARLPSSLTVYRDELRDMFSWLVPPCLEFVQQFCSDTIYHSNMTRVNSLLQMYDQLLSDFHRLDQEKEEKKQNEALLMKAVAEEETTEGEENKTEAKEATSAPAEQGNESTRVQLETLLVFSIVWSIGAGTNAEGRRKFSTFLRELTCGMLHTSEVVMSIDPSRSKGEMRSLPLSKAVSLDAKFHERSVRLPFPEMDLTQTGGERAAAQTQPLVYDFVYDKASQQWDHWMSLSPAYQIPQGAQFHEIIVPTIETVRLSWLLDLFVAAQRHVLLTGSTGTGKTLSVHKKLLQDLGGRGSPYVPLMLSFSARTTANHTQDIIDSKMERRRMGILGPPPGKHAIIFVDDLNMPAREIYGAQPPIELLRQWMDYGGWYDRKTNAFKQIVDVQFVAAQGPPGGGRHVVTDRFLRHFNSICLTPYDEHNMKRIFGTIVSWWLQDFAANLRTLGSSLVDATVDCYATISQELRPTPAKSHYLFNLRDVSKVFQGILSATEENYKHPHDLVKLWAHECTRVFHDRLVNEEDMAWFNDLLTRKLAEHFKVTWGEILESTETVAEDSKESKDGDTSSSQPNRRLLFCDFSDPRSIKKPYVEIKDIDRLGMTMEGYLGDYNNVEKNQMNLVMFSTAIEHVARISRIIRQPFGNALLVGVGGSGRQSLTRLAAFISDYDMFQIEITKAYGMSEWREDLRECMRKAGIHNKPIVFLLTDSQIKHDSFLEDINNILNTGEVPNLFPPEEFMPIIEQVLPDARKANRAENNAAVFAYFIERCKQNIHVVLCMSPVGDQFRNRLRMFPSLVNCTTIDWFHPWPTDALKSVATRFLQNIDLAEETKAGIVEVCVDMQERVIALSRQFREADRRINYVTPSSYLELIKIFQKLFETKRTDLYNNQMRYENGLRKLLETSESVKEMQIQLEALKPELIKSSAETAELIKTIEQRSIQVARTRKVVTAEEQECNEQAEAARKIKEECTAQLEEAMPALNQALKALRVIKKADFDELKSTKVPTQGVILTMTTLCIMLGVEPRKVGPVGKKQLDYWEPAKKTLLSNTKLMEELENYKKDNIPPSVIAKVRPYIKDPDFSPAKVAQASRAAEGFCKWVIAMEMYDRVSKQVQPKKDALKVAEESLAAASEQLAAKKAQLKEVQDLLDDLNNQFEMVNQRKQTLEAQVKECTERLDRAEKLIGGLRGEKDRWSDKAQQLAADYQNVVGNIVVASGVVAYLGAFTAPYREACIRQWVKLLQERGITCASEFQLHKVLGDPVKIRQWGIQQLPVDDFSVDNAVILTTSLRWGLLIDPQEQANRWIKNMENERQQELAAAAAATAAQLSGETSNANTSNANASNTSNQTVQAVSASSNAGGLRVLKSSDEQFSRVLTMAVSMGLPVLVENVGESIDPLLEPLLQRLTFKQGSRTMIRLGSDMVEYNDSFRLYMTTKLQNPHYTPETCTKVTLINFMVTPEGLEDQMLGRVVQSEEPELEAKRSELIVANAEHKRQLQQIEDKILEHLNHSKGHLLDDKDLIQTLQKSKSASKLIEKRVAAAAKTQETINKTRGEYKPVAVAASQLFFCVSDLFHVDPMYQYSLRWFMNLFLKAVRDADRSSDIRNRIRSIQRTFLYVLYQNVCRSLFEKDKLLFSFMLYLRVQQTRSEVDSRELRFLMTGSTGAVFESNGTEGSRPNPTTVAAAEDTKANGSEEDLWLSESGWQQICSLSKLEKFSGLDKHISNNQRAWRAWCESADPDTRPLPGSWERSLSSLQKLLVLRSLRMDKLTNSVQKLVADELGKEFISPPLYDLPAAFAESDPCTPLIFILSPGVDPSQDVFKLGASMGFHAPDKLFSLSLGQGQGPLAENAIREAIDKGTWVLLQNCHVALSWMPTLAKIVDEINLQRTNPDFRLWLTSAPHPEFPASLLQNGIKITNEPPKGLRANLAQSYRAMDAQWTETGFNSGSVISYKGRHNNKQTDEFKRLLFGLCFFHAIVLERRKFGPMGWNKLYEFTEGDLTISKRQLKEFMIQYKEPPLKALRYLVGQLNYGGRVTDDFDRRTISYILEDFLSVDVLKEGHKFDSNGVYHVPAAADIEDYRNYISSLPLDDSSEVFGLHDNVNISAAIKESSALCETLLLLQPRVSASGGLSRESIIAALAKDIEAKLPQSLDVAEAQRRYPIRYEDSMSTVLVQELARYNKLLEVIKNTLASLQRAIQGQEVMSVELEQMGDSMFNGFVPELWSRYAYPSCKPLGSWVSDLCRRIAMFRQWILQGPPPVYWISGFFFTQSFLTGTLQNYARTQGIPIDEISFDFHVMSDITPDHATPPEHGCYIHGLFLEGARWDSSKEGGVLQEPLKRQLFSVMPVIWLKPCETAKLPKNQQVYPCPVYKTSTRAGTLSTTGHSTNFVLVIKLRSSHHERHWVKRGVALLTQLDD